MSEHLTALDATFLELEEVDESAHMHIGAIMVFDPLPDGSVPSHAAVCELLAARLGRLPRYRQRLSQPRTGGLSWPAWEADPRFDIRTHVTRAALPAPGADQELFEWASSFYSQRLDRHRPLWEMVLLEGLAGGRWAIATKTHHCMVDGVGSVDVGHLMFDGTPGPAERPPPVAPTADGTAARAREPLRELADAWTERLAPESVAHVVQAGLHGVFHPREALAKARAALRMLVHEELRAAPHTSLNCPIGTRRRFEVVRVPLDTLREIKQDLGGTLNDVVLTVTAGGLRALLQARGEPLPEGGLRAMVPLNVRLASEHLALGNKVSSLFVELPVAEERLLRRYRETVRASAELKSAGEQAAGSTAIVEIAGLAPPVLHATIAQALYATRLFNVTITNVPGPPHTLYAFGAPLREVHPLVPLAAEHAVGVAVVSYDGEMFFGIVADRDTVPDFEALRSGLVRSLEELLAQARAMRRPYARGTRPRARQPSTARRFG